MILITGELVELGPIRAEHLSDFLRWVNDPNVTRTLALPGMPMTLEAEEDWFRSASRSTKDAMFTIYPKGSDQPIGNCGLHAIDLRHRTANFGIMIGERSAWNMGYGTDATRALVSYGFDVLGLQNIMLEVYSTNLAGRRAYEKAGFSIIGTRRSAQSIGRTRVDVMLMDIVPDDVPPSAMHELLIGGPPRH